MKVNMKCWKKFFEEVNEIWKDKNGEELSGNI